ncbi:MAG: hypothetical protein R6W68_03320 [Ignavibacteriaceae bacterium]
MNKKFFYIAGENFKTLRFFIFTVIFSSVSIAQSINNLDIFYLLVDSAATEAAQDVSKVTEEISISVELGTYYTIFENPIISKFSSKGIKVIRSSGSSQQIPHLNFVLDNAEVNYKDQERDGFLGDFFVTREVTISGNYLLTSADEITSAQMKEFSYNFNDKVKADSLDGIENRSFPFTQGQLPPEPFFSSLLEPVLAVSAAAVAVILFFSVRSK